MLYLGLFCASVSKMCPKVTAALLYAIIAYKSFHRRDLLSESGGTCILTDHDGTIAHLLQALLLLAV